MRALSRRSWATRAGEPIGRALARLQRGRAAGGNALRAAVLGVNDGLVSNASLVMGVAGAGVASKDILVTGVAGLIAGACSMAMGEWISVQSSRELSARELAVEQRHIATESEVEQAELALVYEQKGLHPREARRVAERLSADPATALDTHAREELGIDPDELGGSPWVAAGASFALFVVGAILPILPFVFLSGNTAVAMALGVSALGLFGIGAAITLLTGRSVLVSGFRQLALRRGGVRRDLRDRRALRRRRGLRRADELELDRRSAGTTALASCAWSSVVLTISLARAKLSSSVGTGPTRCPSAYPAALRPIAR